MSDHRLTHLAVLAAGCLALAAAGQGPSSTPPASTPPASTPPASARPASAPPAQKPWSQDDPRYGLLTPIPDRGAVPPIVEMLDGLSDRQLQYRARVREYKKQIRQIRHRYLGNKRAKEVRAEGIARLREFTDAAAFKPLITELKREDQDVRLAVLDHFAEQGDAGQAALAWVAITDDDDAMRYEATRLMTRPASRPVLAVLDSSLRSPKHTVANNAGGVAGALSALKTIPLLIFAQATADSAQSEGDLAWIAIQTQQAYVQRLEPVVGDAVGAFQPIIGIVSEGVILRVVDAVAINYRTTIHRSLVAMTTDDWGQSTEYLGYDMRAWWEWYNGEYVPFKNEQAQLARLAAEPE